MENKSLYSNKELELNSLIEFSQLINSNLNLDFILGNILLSIMGKMLITKGMFLVNINDKYLVKSIKGLPKEILNKQISFEIPKIPYFRLDDIESGKEFFQEIRINYFFKIYFSNKPLGILGLGIKHNGSDIANNEIIFIETLLNISATSIENTLKFEEINELNKKLDLQIQQMTSLFEMSKEFNTNFTDTDKIIKLLSYTLLGNYGIQDLIIFTKFNSDNFNILTKKNIPELKDIDLQVLEEIKSPLVIEHESKNKFLDFLKKNNFKLLIPILNKSNDVESVVCLGDRMNKMAYSKNDIAFLSSLVNISAISLDNTLLFNEYIEKQKMENEINLAKEIQELLLPQTIPYIEGYEIAGKNKPALNVGGDYYDIIKIDEHRIALIIADVSGKGLPASLLMSNIQSAIHSFFKLNGQKSFDIAEVTGKLNSLIYENTSSEKFITFFWGIINNTDNSFLYSNAGHNPPILFKKSLLKKESAKKQKVKLFTTLNEGGLMLGIIDNFQYAFGKIYLEKDDSIIFYTDGITEAQNPNDEEFGEDKLLEILKNNINNSGKEIIDLVLNEIVNFAGSNKQYDDETLIILNRIA